MPYGLLSLVVLVFFLSLQVQQKQIGNMPEQSTGYAMRVSDAQSFVNYRDAVSSFQRSNPTFIGTVTYTQLQNIGYQFSPEIQAKTSNAITQVSTGTGRTITVYGALAQGAVSEILKLTDNDASFGVASGTNWYSSAIGGNGVATPLATVVPNGATVAVIQIGG